MTATPTAALLVLGDGRLPAGGHAHSGGLEEAVRDGRVTDLATLARFLTGRLATAGLVAAALAAAAHGGNAGRSAYASGGQTCHGSSDVDFLVRVDAEADARTASPALRSASRRQGRQLLRAGRAMWPAVLLDDLAAAVPQGVHHPVALGAVARAAKLDAAAAALIAASWAVTGPASAAVRLLSLDPLSVHALVADLGPAIDEVAATAAAAADGPLEDLPCAAAPLLDIGAERHATWEARLFAS